MEGTACKARCWWITPVILATQEAEIRTMVVQSQPREVVLEPLSRKTLHKQVLLERIKVWALSSSSSTVKNKEINLMCLCFSPLRCEGDVWPPLVLFGSTEEHN
jgi:hypothetical protein